MTTTRARLLSRLLALSSLLVGLLLALPAAAGGRIVWKQTHLQPTDNTSWKIEIEVHLSKAPDVAHVPVRFKFEPTVYYERTLVDGKEGPQLRKVPLTGRQPLIEGVDLGFLDAGTGKIEKRTRFSFKITRGHGYEAGEYRVTVLQGDSGQAIGTPTTLVLEGENEVIDRRAMIFTGEKKKKQDDDEGSDKSGKTNLDSPETEQHELSPKDDAFWAGGPKEESNDPQTVKEKPGGCGCRVQGAVGTSADGLGWAGLLLGLALARRARRG